jgi:hypothetical protein
MFVKIISDSRAGREGIVIARRPQADVAISLLDSIAATEIATVALLLRNDSFVPWNSESESSLYSIGFERSNEGGLTPTPCKLVGARTAGEEI